MDVLAFDFGASSGRAILGTFESGKLSLKEIHRFENAPVYMNDGLYWDLPKLFSEIKQGIYKAKDYDYASIGIDTWGVDYAYITKDGHILSNPYCYRDVRCVKGFDNITKSISESELYKKSGIQVMNINTMFQIADDVKNHSDVYNIADKMLLMPDLFGFLLTGRVYAERSMASTTGLLDPNTKKWNYELIKRLGFDENKLPPLVDSGEKIGTLTRGIADETETSQKEVIAVACHDTASAVVSVPAASDSFAYISCGTWSLIGTELPSPCINERSEQFNITNETGYDKTTRFLKNIIGLWIIQETRRQFLRDGKDYSYADMEKAAREAEPFKCFIDPDAPMFVPPGNQIKRIREFCKSTNQCVPETDGEIVRTIYESLAMKYKYAFDNLKKCAGRNFEAIHIVGGGTKDKFLCQMTADAANVPVIAGPIEATAAGNIAVQLISLGAIKDLKEARKVIANSFDIEHFTPEQNGFDENYDRFLKLIK